MPLSGSKSSPQFFLDGLGYQGSLWIHISVLGFKKLGVKLLFIDAPLWLTYIVSSGLECLLIGVGGGAEQLKLYACLLCFAEQMKGHYLLCSLCEGKVELMALKH